MLGNILQHFVAEGIGVFLPTENDIAVGIPIELRIIRIPAGVGFKRRIGLPIRNMCDVVPIVLHTDVGIGLVKVNVVLTVLRDIERVALRRDRGREAIGLEPL